MTVGTYKYVFTQAHPKFKSENNDFSLGNRE